MVSATDQQLVSKVVVEVLEEGLDDWVQVWQIASLVVEVAGVFEPIAVRRLGLQVIRYLLESHLMEVGDVNEVGFKRWEMPLDKSLAAIESDWPTDRIPTLGDMCWLSNTELGDSHAKIVLTDGWHHAS